MYKLSISLCLSLVYANKYDALFEMEMAKAKQNYMKRKKNQGVIGSNGSWDELQRLTFRGIKIDSYVPLAYFFLSLFGENFDYSLAIQSCTEEQQEMWGKIIAPKVQGEMSPELLGEYCVYYVNSLEATRMTDDEDLAMSWFGMPISPKNCMP